MNCKMCDTSLYNNITFSNIFNTKYEVHRKCISELNFNLEEEVIPIDSNIIIYDYVFLNINDKYNEEYLWFLYLAKVLEKHLNSKEWSMLIFYDENIDYFLKNYNPYLIINLSNNPILLISLNKIGNIYLEHL